MANFKFTGDIWAVPEGTPVFPREPVITVRAPAIQAQLLETYLLLCVNHQSLIATKANRVVRAAEGRTVLEFGSRRAQGADAAILGARAAYIGGCHGTACTISDQLYGVKAGGTMAHAWVQMFDSEYEAFKTYTVAVGPESDQQLLQDLAERCGGRFYYTDINSGIPKIFAQEIILSGKSYLVNEEFVPVITSNSELIEGLMDEGVPTLDRKSTRLNSSHWS